MLSGTGQHGSAMARLRRTWEGWRAVLALVLHEHARSGHVRRLGAAAQGGTARVLVLEAAAEGGFYGRALSMRGAGVRGVLQGVNQPSSVQPVASARCGWLRWLLRASSSTCCFVGGGG